MIDRAIRKKVERAFYNYNVLKLVRDDLIGDVAYKGLTTNYDKLPGVCNFGNAKENQFINYLSKTEANRWVAIVDKVIKHFEGTDKIKFIDRRYFKRDSVQYVCTKLYISRRTYFEWVEDIIIEAALEAARQNMV